MSNRKEFLTQLRARIADPDTRLIACGYMDNQDNCCVIGLAALEAGMDPESVSSQNHFSVRDRQDIVEALKAKGLTINELRNLQMVNDHSFSETRKARVLQEIDHLLKEEEV